MSYNVFNERLMNSDEKSAIRRKVSKNIASDIKTECQLISNGFPVIQNIPIISADGERVLIFWSIATSTIRRGLTGIVKGQSFPRVKLLFHFEVRKFSENNNVIPYKSLLSFTIMKCLIS